MPPCPPRKFQVAAERMLVEAAQKGLDTRQVASLMPERMVTVGVLGEERTLIVVGGRSKNFFKVAYDCAQLPVLPPWHRLSELYLKEGHEKGHGGLDSTVKRSRACLLYTSPSPRD